MAFKRPKLPPQPKIYTMNDSPDEFASFSKNLELSESQSVIMFGLQKEPWAELPVKLPFSIDTSASGHLPDYSLFEGIPIFSSRAYTAVDDLVGNKNDFWPIGNYQGADYFMVHIRNYVDGLIPELSESREINGKPFRVSKYVFDIEKVQNQHLFYVPQGPGQIPLVSDKFRKAFKACGVTGAHIKKVYR